MLEARAIHTGRSAYNHLLAMAQTHGIGRARVDEVIDLVGLQRRGPQARRRLLARHGPAARHRRRAARRPATLILDEPVNGLDPEGILWIRNLLKGLAAEGRTVFLSSHLMSEMALTAEHLDRHRPRPADRRHDRSRRSSRRPRATPPCSCARPQPSALRDGCSPRASTSTSAERGVLEVHGLRQRADRRARARRGIVLHELTPRAGLAGGGVHGPDRRRRRVPRAPPDARVDRLEEAA